MAVVQEVVRLVPQACVQRIDEQVPTQQITEDVVEEFEKSCGKSSFRKGSVNRSSTSPFHILVCW